MDQKFVQWLPLIIALIGGLTALYQIRSNNITNARIRWLENFKHLLSEFVSECTALIIEDGVSKSFNEKQEEVISEMAKSYYGKIIERTVDHLKVIESNHDLIKLNLNPKEELHIKFEKVLDAYMGYVNKLPVCKSFEEYSELTKKMHPYSHTLTLLARYIIKLEWERTKKSFLYKVYYMKFGKGKTILNEALNLQILPETSV
jgi:hypothetical protein